MPVFHCPDSFAARLQLIAAKLKYIFKFAWNPTFAKNGFDHFR